MPIIDDLSSYLAGGGTVLVGWMLGRISRPRRGPKKPSYRCASCGHGYGFHRGGGACQERSGLDLIDCKCQRYIGETPPPSYDEIVKGMP